MRLWDCIDKNLILINFKDSRPQLLQNIWSSKTTDTIIQLLSFSIYIYKKYVGFFKYLKERQRESKWFHASGFKIMA